MTTTCSPKTRSATKSGASSPRPGIPSSRSRSGGTASAESGWAVPTWPEEWFGRGLPARGRASSARSRRRDGALGPPAGLGHAARRAHDPRPRHRRAEGALPPPNRHRPGGLVPAVQRARRRLRPRRRCRRAAERDGDEWVINGQKVWTSGGAVLRPRHAASPAPIPTSPKHQGITYFAVRRWTSPASRCGRSAR